MSRPFSRLPGRVALATAVVLGLGVRPAAAADHLRPGAPPRIEAPRGLSPRALAVWHWRQAQDVRPGSDFFSVSPRASFATTDDAPETLLNDTTGTIGNNQDQVAVASYPGRNIVVVWRDDEAGNSDIRAQLFDPSGNLLPVGPEQGGAFVVNDEVGAFDRATPAVAMNASGDFVVVWASPDGSSPSNIYLQKFNADGTPVLGNQRINNGTDETARNTHGQPAVDMDDAGNIVAAWTDDRRVSTTGQPGEATTDIYVTRIHPDLSSGFKPFSGSAPINTPQLRIEPVDNVAPMVRFTRQGPTDSAIVLVWQAKDLANRGGRRVVLARRIQTLEKVRGFPLDTLVTVVNDVVTGTPSDAVAASSPQLLAPSPVDTTRSMVVAWVDSTGDVGSIRGRRLYPAQWTGKQSPFRDASTVVSDVNGAGAIQPGLSRLGDGSVVLTWAASIDGTNFDVYGRALHADLTAIAAGAPLSTSSAPLPRSRPAAVPFGDASGTSGWFAAWVEYHGSNNDIMYRLGAPAGGTETQLGQERQPDQIHPDIAFSGGEGVAVWADYRNGRLDPDIYGQRLDAASHPVGHNFRVNSDPAGSYQEYPRVGIDGAGNFTVAWEDSRTGTINVFVRRFQADGTPAGPEFAISRNDTTQQFRPAIATTPAGASALVWEENERAFNNVDLHISDIYLRPLGADGSPIGNTVRVSPVLGDTVDLTSVNQNDLNAQPKFNPCVAVDSAGNGFVFWDVTAQVVQRSDSVVLVVSNPDVDGRCFSAPSRLPAMKDTDGRVIQSQAFSVADTLNSGFLFPQLHSRVAYVGAGNYALAFEDERLGLLSREDIRARLLAVSFNGDTATVYTPSETFPVNDDIADLAPDPVTGEVKQVSASQFEPVIAGSAPDHTFSVAWSDRRTTTSYNIMRQSYHLLPGGDLSQPPTLRFLGRNTFCNADWQLTVLAHGVPTIAYSGANQVVVGWESNQLNGTEMDVWARALTQAPDTCAMDTCSRGASGHVDAFIAGGGSVTLSWRIEGPYGSASLLRHDLSLEGQDPSAVPAVVANSARLAQGGEIQDPVGNNPSNYFYELMVDGHVVGTASPRIPVVSFSIALGAAPNPARGQSRIRFAVPGRSGDRAAVSLRLYDVTGREVDRLAEGTMPAGVYSVNWTGQTHSGTRAGAGVYFMRYTVGSEVMTRKLLWLR